MDNKLKSQFLALRQKIIESDFSLMNESQLEAVTCVRGPLLVLAGAGSGKTTAVVNRIANMIRYGDAYHSGDVPSFVTEDFLNELQYNYNNQKMNKDCKNSLAVNPVNPYNILAITFTNKAANELKERLNTFLSEEGAGVTACTFHSICARILRQFSENLGYTNHFSVYDIDDVKRVIKDCQKILNIDEKLLSCRFILSEISRAKNEMINYKQYEATVESDHKKADISKVYKLYQSKLKEADVMDFDDLLVNTVLLFKKHPEILEYFQNKFEYIMVDEYQDTNTVQYEFVNLLAGKSKNLCVVGDDDQSIYKFRGANIENILNFEKSYKGSKVIRLEQNYRSTSNIINAANAIISNNSARKGKTLWTANQGGEKIKVHTARDEIDEAKYIADKITEKVAGGRRYSDFAVLYRMNSQSNIIERTLVRAGIPHRVVGGYRFYERKEIKDIISYLNVINNPADEVRLRRIINRPKRSIGDKTVLKVLNISHTTGQSFLEVARTADQIGEFTRAGSKLVKFAQTIDSLIEKHRSEQVPLLDLYNYVLEKTNFIEALKDEDSDSETRIQNIRELATNIKIYQKEYGENATLAGFLEEVSLMTALDDYDQNSDMVSLMTIHAAKGLEFPCVFLPGMEEGIFPGGQLIVNPEDVEEERRLAYVAVTRAKEQVTVVNAQSRMIFGIISHDKPSRFIAEMPEELIDRSAVRNIKKLERGDLFSKAQAKEKTRLIESARTFANRLSVSSDFILNFSAGDIVKHKIFGNGNILSTKPMGNDVLLEIMFKQAGVKKLMANFSNLTKVNS